MKKTILAILMAMLATTAFAEAKCEGGDVFEGVNDGHEYCISKSKMNWWSAFTWCQHQGRHLPSLQEVCEGWHGASGPVCDNLIKSDVTATHCWTANPSGSTSAWIVVIGTGSIFSHSSVLRNNGTAIALCY